MLFLYHIIFFITYQFHIQLIYSTTGTDTDTGSSTTTVTANLNNVQEDEHDSFYIPKDFDINKFHQFGVFTEDISHRKRLNSKFMKELHSQQKEDIILFHQIFYGVVNGTFIESGALDGKKFSNAWAYEHALGLTGLNIEGSPLNYKNLNENRPNCVNVHAALCREPRIVHYAEHSWGEVNGILEFMPDSFVKREMVQKAYKSTIDSNGAWSYSGMDETKTKVVPIQCQQFHEIIQKAQLTHIDLWSLVSSYSICWIVFVLGELLRTYIDIH
mgnify:CR=1 FL=1